MRRTSELGHAGWSKESPHYVRSCPLPIIGWAPATLGATLLVVALHHFLEVPDSTIAKLRCSVLFAGR
jgi:hypothetical protein